MMRRRHRILVAATMLAPACAPTAAHRSTSSAPPPTAGPRPVDQGAAAARPDEEAATSPAGPSTTTTEASAPTTTVTVTVPTTTTHTHAPVTTTFVLPETADDDLSDVEWLIRQTFPETPDKAVRVARCESGLDPAAVSPDGANWGLMQVNVVHKALAAAMGYSWNQMLQPAPNLAVARAIYDRAGGWGPWSCS
jgi:hypothetical protein